MRHILIVAFCAVIISSCQAQSQIHDKQSSADSTKKEERMKSEYTSHLTEQEFQVLVNKATDRPGENGYTNLFEEGVYHCRACGAALYKSDTKFHSGCGWPSFDAEIPGSVHRISDVSFGMVRTEIVCANCNGHLGHVFEGERFTETNTRHCVNTSSIIFHPKNKQTAYFALGQFYQAQALLQSVKGVLYSEVGYIHNGSERPSFADVENGKIGTVEAVKVEFDPSILPYSVLVDSVFRTTIPQDTKPQFRFALFPVNSEQEIAAKTALAGSGKTGIWTIESLTNFGKAELEHQNYQRKNRKSPR